MRAIVLVGGEATRMRPLSWRTPKQLMPVVHRPLLTWLLERLARHDVRDVTLALLERNAAIRDHYADGRALGMRISYSYEDEPLGSGGAIAQAAAGWEDPFFVCNGDLITDIDFQAMAACHRERDAELTISLHEVDDPSPFGVVVLDGDQRISRFVEKPPRETAPSCLINAGTWLFEPSLLSEMDAGRFNRVEDELFPALASSGRGIYGFRADGYWEDVGRPESLLRTNLELVSEERTLGERVAVEDGATIERPSVVGNDCRIAGGAIVSRSVLWDGVRIERNAVVRDSILASNVTVEEEAVIEHSVIAHGATVRRGVAIRGQHVEPDAVVSG